MKKQKILLKKTLTSNEVLLNLAKYEFSLLPDKLKSDDNIMHLEYLSGGGIEMWITPKEEVGNIS